MPYGASSRLTGTTLQGGTTRTNSNNNNPGKSRFGVAANRPSSALISPRGSAGGGSILANYSQSDIQRAANNNSRSSSISRHSTNNANNNIVGRSHTPGINNSFSHNRSLLSNGNSPNIPRTTQAALEEFSKPTVAAEARNASSSALVERLRNIVSTHEERVTTSNNNNNQQKNSASSSSSTFSSQQQRQMEAMRQQSSNRMNVQRGLDFDHQYQQQEDFTSQQQQQVSRVVPNESRAYSSSTTNRIVVGSYLDTGSSNNNSAAPSAATTPATSAPNSTMKPNRGKTRTEWRGGMEYSDDDDDDEYEDEEEEYDDDEDDDEPQQQQQMQNIKRTPQRPPPLQNNNNANGDGGSPSSNPRSRNVSPQNVSSSSPPQPQLSNTNTTAIPGFSWCRDWTRRGMRPEEVTFNEQNRVSCEATTHVEPRGIDMWHSVFDKKQEGSFLCRRCGLPVFEATSMTRPIPRAGHITFDHRLARTTVPELCPKDGKIIIKCARCRGFIADIYDVQSKTVPPLIRASSWSLWHDASVRVPENVAQSVGPYIEEEEDGMDEDDLQKMLDRVDPLMTADDFF